MAVTESDLRTFASSLKKERQPDVDIIVKVYRWQVHSHVISGQGFFGKLCSGAPEDSKRREVHLDDDDPVIIAHLILWWYTEEYDDEAMTDLAGFDLRSLMKYGKVSPSTCSNEAMFVPETEPGIGEEDIDWTNPSPISLHAKMYLIADKYDITELRERAVYEITEILGSLKEALLPCLAHFFVTNTPGDNSMGCNNSNFPGDKNIDASSPAVTSGNSPAKCTISEQRDPELWKILADTASKHFLSYRADPDFQQIITCNPRFHWDVMGRVASMLEAAQDQLAASTPAEVSKTPKKRVKKKQENSRGSEPVRDKEKEKEKEDGAHIAKKAKKEP